MIAARGEQERGEMTTSLVDLDLEISVETVESREDGVSRRQLSHKLSGRLERVKGAFDELVEPHEVGHQPRVYLTPRVGDGLLKEVGGAAPLRQLVVRHSLDDPVACQLVHQLPC